MFKAAKRVTLTLCTAAFCLYALAACGADNSQRYTYAGVKYVLKKCFNERYNAVSYATATFLSHMRIYITASDRIIAFNANNRSKRWCVRDEQEVTPITSTMPTMHTLPTVSNVAGSTSILKPDPPAPLLGFNQATEANGVIYVGSENGNTYAFRASDGTLLWHNF